MVLIRMRKEETGGKAGGRREKGKRRRRKEGGDWRIEYGEFGKGNSTQKKEKK